MMKKTIAIILLLVSCVSLSFASPDAYKSFIKGAIDLKAGKAADAKKEYEKAVSLDPSALQAYKDLSYIYLQTGDRASAYKTAQKVDELGGATAQTAVFLGSFYATANDTATAQAFWDKALVLDPDNETAMIYLASHYALVNDLAKSEIYWKKYLKEQPDSVIAWLQLALVQEKLGRSEDALKTLDKVIKLNPSAVDAYMSKARIYESKNKFDLAVKEYQKYITVSPDNPFVYVFMGRGYLELNDLKNAEEALLKAKGMTDNVDALKATSYWLGGVYEKQWKIDAAAKEYEYIISKEDNALLRSKIGYFYSILRNFEKADEQFQKVLDKDPSNMQVMYLAALNYLDWGKTDKALDLFKRIVAQSPDFADAYFFMAMAYDRKNDFDNEEKALLKAIELNPNHAKALNHLAFIYADRGIKLDEAEQYIGRALKLEPKNGTYLDTLGWLYYKQGRYESARQALMTAASLMRDPMIYDHLGDVTKALGRSSEAWISYALSYDMKRDDKVKEKLDAARKEIPADEFYKQMLLRSESNFLKVFSVKAGFTANFSAGIIGGKKTFINFSFTRSDGAVIELPGNIMGGAKIRVQGSSVTYTPQALETSVPDEYREVINFAAEILSRDFFRRFSPASVVEKGDKLIFTSEDGAYELVLNTDTAFIERITKGKATVEMSNYEAFLVSWLPKKIVLNSKNPNFKATFETQKFTLPENKPAENKQQ